MNLAKLLLLRLGVLALLAEAVSGCEWGTDTYRVAGRYFITLSEDGGRFWFDDPDRGKVMLAPAVPVEQGVAGHYVVVRDQEGYRVYPDTAQTAAAARAAQFGPLGRAACQQKLLQLTGDTVRLGSVI